MQDLIYDKAMAQKKAMAQISLLNYMLLKEQVIFCLTCAD